MDEARSQALRGVSDFFPGRSAEQYKERLSRYNGNIGDYSQASQFLIHNNTYVGQNLSPSLIMELPGPSKDGTMDQCAQ